MIKRFDMNGSGHEFDPYIIKNETDLSSIVDDIYGYYILNNNIYLENEWNPILNFYGTIDGRGFIISNLTIRKVDADNIDRSYIGFIGVLRAKATVRNLTLVTSAIGVEGLSATYNGVLAAQAYASDYGFLIENVSIAGNIITGGDRCGGLIGLCDSKNSSIKNCIVNVFLSGGKSRSGAVVGYLWDGSIHCSNVFYSSNSGTSSAGVTADNVSNFSDIAQYNNKLDFNSQWYINDEFNIPVLKQPKKFMGDDNITGFIEGKTEPTKVVLTDQYGNELDTQITTDFEFKNYNIEKLNGNIKIGDTLTPVEYYINQERGYIYASALIIECLDSDFVIHCFRSSDKQFIGEYPIIDDRYTIDNLNLTQTYDIMLHDKNKIVETQVHSRRTPSIYQ